MSPPPLWERSDATRAVESLLERGRCGTGGTLFVTGGAGLGKTALLDHAVRSAATGTRIALAQGDRMETMLPRGVLSQLTETLGTWQGWEGAPQHGSGAPSVAAHSYRALRWLTSVADAPLLIAIDDLQWSDTYSLTLLSFLCRRIGRLPVAVIATLRPWPRLAEEVALHLTARGHAHIERLSPLSEAAAGRLIGRVSRQTMSPTSVRTRWEACGGNPLLLTLVAATAEDRSEGGSIGPLTAHSYGPMEEPLLSRFACLTAASRRCAEAATLLRSPFEYECVAKIAEVSPREASASLEALCRSGLVVQAEGGGLQFAHPIIRWTLVGRLPAPLRTRLERRALEVVERPSPAMDRVGCPASPAIEHLTNQEQRVAALAARGFSNQHLATTLCVTVNTIETHLKRIYAKLGICSRRQLMTMSLKGFKWDGSQSLGTQ